MTVSASHRQRRHRDGPRPCRLLKAALMLWAFWLVACGPHKGTIGAILGRSVDGRLFLRKVPAELGASKAGLAPGDEIILIDGKDVRNMSTEEVHDQLSGGVGEPVKLTLFRRTQVLRVVVTRTRARSSRWSRALRTDGS